MRLAAITALLLWLCACGPKPPGEIKAAAEACTARGDARCAIAGWKDYLEAAPGTRGDYLTLSRLEAGAGAFADAARHGEQASRLGAVDDALVESVADNWEKAGRPVEAAHWRYHFLAAHPDDRALRARMASLLLKGAHPFEALALLNRIDGVEAERQAALAAIKAGGATGETNLLTLPPTGEVFVGPLIVGQSGPTFVALGAEAYTGLTDAFLDASKADYTVVEPHLRVTTESGKVIVGRMVKVRSMKLGPLEMHDVNVTVCPRCTMTVGISDLTGFDVTEENLHGMVVTRIHRHGAPS
jgi:hypothetical protein